MKINVAKSAGFCFGVRRAIEIALKTAEEKEKDVYMLGDIVHNEFVVEQIKKAGIKVVNSIDKIKGGILLLRAHGTVPEIYKKAKEKNLKIVDATCPMVLEIHKITRKLENENYQVVVIGDHEHDEVKAISAQAKKPIIIENPSDVNKIRKKYKKIGIVVQSTQNIEKVKKIINKLIDKTRELRFINTICKPTQDHQDEIRKMPLENDVMIIVGSFTSANTRRLTEISKSLNPKTYQVESAKDLKKEWFNNCKSVGISAGASTPDYLIREVINRIKELGKK